jgi:hypothetical protein
MKEAFLAAIIDTLLPGEACPPSTAAALPSGTAAGLVLQADDTRHAAILRLIAERGGGESSFAAASTSERVAVLAEVEKQSFDAFRGFVTALLQDYYDAQAVLGAMGWRSGGAQPQGHAVPEADAATLGLLDKVRARGPLWRDPGEKQR